MSLRSKTLLSNLGQFPRYESQYNCRMFKASDANVIDRISKTIKSNSAKTWYNINFLKKCLYMTLIIVSDEYEFQKIHDDKKFEEFLINMYINIIINHMSWCISCLQLETFFKSCSSTGVNRAGFRAIIWVNHLNFLEDFW